MTGFIVRGMIVRGIKIIPLTRHLVQGICANFSGNSRFIDFFIKMCRPFRAWFFSEMITRGVAPGYDIAGFQPSLRQGQAGVSPSFAIGLSSSDDAAYLRLGRAAGAEPNCPKIASRAISGT